jgi:hypothetical protein
MAQDDEAVPDGQGTVAEDGSVVGVPVLDVQAVYLCLMEAKEAWVFLGRQGLGESSPHYAYE